MQIGADQVTIKAVLINDTVADGHFGCSRVVGAIETLTAENGISIIGRSPVHKDWQSDQSVLSAMSEADAVLVNGEGTIHDDRPAARRLAGVADYCASIGKPAVLLNASWFSNGPDLLDMARRFAIIAVRESESEKQLRDAGLTCRRMADLALYEEIQPLPRSNRVGVTDSVLSDVALQLDLFRRRHKGEIVNLFHGQDGIAGFRFFLQLFGARRALGDPVRLSKAVRAAIAFYRSQMPTDDSLLKEIAQLTLLVTGRFHAAIFALATLTPLLAVESNTPKISATLKDAGVDPWRVRSDAGFDAELLQRASRWTGDEEANILDFLSDNRARQKQLFKDIAALAA
jgi:polysaccharide pyruvyl transferase WcaK-like protein